MEPAVRKAIGFPQRQRLSREELFEFHLVICLSSDKQRGSAAKMFSRFIREDAENTETQSFFQRQIEMA